MRKRGAALLLAAALAVTGLAGCGASSGETASGGEKVRLMVWSPQNDQSKDNGEWLQTMCEAFAEEHPEWDITFVYGVADEASAAGQVSQDPEASADVFMFANDTLTTLTDASALAKFGGKYREEIESMNTPEVLDSLIMDEDLYGVPFTTNTWFMYYDKSVFSEEDIQNLDTMLEKGVVSFPFTNSWYLPAFYLGNGCTLFGDGTDEAAGVDFGGQKAVDVTDYLIDLRNHPNFRIDADGSGIAGLRDGSINAIFTGSWDATAEVYETGLLTYGNANPESVDFNSLADFIFTDGAVEIKLPWQLLNFANPSEMMVHDDYYEHYGIEYIQIDEMYVGLADSAHKEYRVDMASFPLEGWGKKVTYHERLKESYYILQNYWTSLK